MSRRIKKVAQNNGIKSTHLYTTQHTHTHIYTHTQILHKDPMYSKGNSTQHSVMIYMRKESEKEWMCVYL